MNNPIPVVNLHFGRERFQKWRLLKGLVYGMRDYTTVDICLPDEDGIIQKCRMMLAAYPGGGKPPWEFDLRVHLIRGSNTLRVTKVYRP